VFCRVLVGSSSLIVPLVPPSWAVLVDAPPTPTFGVADDVVSTLKYAQILGQGTYKMVYLVSGHDNRHALAVERMRSKGEARDEIRGIKIVQELQKTLRAGDDKYLFEQIEGWWLQNSNLPPFMQGGELFPKGLDRMERTTDEPGNFLGSRYLVSLKPVYDIDLKSLAQRAPVLHLVGEEGEPDIVGDYALTEEAAIKLVADLCRAGRLMHEVGIVHRDIKPKNIMISNGRPVVIDFGFARFGRPEAKDNSRVCVVEQGRVKGEVAYVLAEDVAKYRGCQQGDAYAMGKAIFELIFGAPKEEESSGRLSITETEAALLNKDFRDEMFNDYEYGMYSRFRMSQDVCDHLLYVIRGLSREYEPFTFAKAEKFMSSYFVDRIARNKVDMK